MVFRYIRYSKLDISLLIHLWVRPEALRSSAGDLPEPYRMFGKGSPTILVKTLLRVCKDTARMTFM